MTETQIRWLLARGLSRPLVVWLDVIVMTCRIVILGLVALALVIIWGLGMYLAVEYPQYRLIGFTIALAPVVALFMHAAYDTSNDRVPRRKPKEDDQ